MGEGIKNYNLANIICETTVVPSQCSYSVAQDCGREERGGERVSNEVGKSRRKEVGVTPTRVKE